MVTCTFLRRGIFANPYIAEGLNGHTALTEHLYWHASNVHAPGWAINYLQAAACDWTAGQIDFADRVFNSAPVLKERAAWMAVNEGRTYAQDADLRVMYSHKATSFLERTTGTLSKNKLRKDKNRWGDEIWPWDREGFKRPTSARRVKV